MSGNLVAGSALLGRRSLVLLRHGAPPSSGRNGIGPPRPSSFVGWHSAARGGAPAFGGRQPRRPLVAARARVLRALAARVGSSCLLPYPSGRSGLLVPRCPSLCLSLPSCLGQSRSGAKSVRLAPNPGGRALATLGIRACSAAPEPLPTPAQIAALVPRAAVGAGTAGKALMPMFRVCYLHHGGKKKRI